MNADNPLITVLVPIYNSPDMISSIDSILCQDYSNIQLIILDDHSLDFDRDAIEKRIAESQNIIDHIIIHNSRNIGTVRNLNQGLRMAKGDYIFTLAGDDLFKDSGVLSDWVAEFKKVPEDVITARRESYNEDFSIFYSELPNDSEVDMIRELSPNALFEELCKNKNFIFGCCTAYRKTFFLKMGLYDEKYRLIEDYPTVLRFLRNGGSIHYFPRVVVKHRGGGGSAIQYIKNKYIFEENKIVKNEILPFTGNRKSALENHRRWLWNVRQNEIKLARTKFERIMYKCFMFFECYDLMHNKTS